jgi:hypothetical protein
MYIRGGGDAAVVSLLLRLVSEVEALREALASPETPEAVRRSYRLAYVRTAVLSHNSAGPSGGIEKVFETFFPRGGQAPGFGEPAAGQGEPYAAELAMMQRLGATEEEKRQLRDEMASVSKLT